jgi:membrane protease YdiL (CAAX protease family)
MSQPAAIPAPSDRTAEAALWTAIGAVCALFVIRPWFAGHPWTSGALLAAYLLIGIVAALAPVPAGIPAPFGVVPVTLIGVAAVLLATSAPGPSFPLPRTTEILALNTVAAVAEELFFRRMLFGGLLRFGALVAVAGSAIVFALVHVPIYGAAAFPVDLGAGLLFSWQRWASGGWGASATTHAFANLLAVVR